MPKVFISYGRDESYGQNLATEAQKQLQSAGFEVFRDVTGLNPGDRWDTKLEFELESSDVVVLVVSEKVRKSEWVHNEISMAKEIGLPIIPVIAEKVRMPLWLRHLQALDFSQQPDWPQLIDAIQGHAAAPEINTTTSKSTIREQITDQDTALRERLIQPHCSNNTGQDQYGQYADLQFNNVTQRFRLINPGTFWMGSSSSEAGRWGNETQHQVTLTKPFWMADTTVTQALWLAVLGNHSSHFATDLNNPVESVSWNDAQEFIQRLNSQVGGLVARLPTEAQWEYSCRAGTNTPFSFGSQITPEQVNYDGDLPPWEKGLDRKTTILVKSLPENPWGLYEMHGNVWEWCSDSWLENLGSEPAIDPENNEAGAGRVVRGGSWSSDGRNARSACRVHGSPDDRGSYIGLRLSFGHPSASSGGGSR